jgi:hypothetical protein
MWTDNSIIYLNNLIKNALNLEVFIRFTDYNDVPVNILRVNYASIFRTFSLTQRKDSIMLYIARNEGV